jgi:hypothetical protein
MMSDLLALMVGWGGLRMRPIYGRKIGCVPVVSDDFRQPIAKREIARAVVLRARTRTNLVRCTA